LKGESEDILAFKTGLLFQICPSQPILARSTSQQQQQQQQQPTIVFATAKNSSKLVIPAKLNVKLEPPTGEIIHLLLH